MQKRDLWELGPLGRRRGAAAVRRPLSVRHSRAQYHLSFSWVTLSTSASVSIWMWVLLRDYIIPGDVERREQLCYCEPLITYRVSNRPLSVSADTKDILVMLSDMDINAIAGTLKLYFRELPEPLLTDRLYPAFMEGIGV